MPEYSLCWDDRVQIFCGKTVQLNIMMLNRVQMDVQKVSEALGKAPRTTEHLLQSSVRVLDNKA